MNKRTLTILIMLSIFMLFFSACPRTAPGIKIGLSLADASSAVQANDAQLIGAWAQKTGSTVVVLDARRDAKLQNSQIEDLVYQGAKAVIVVAGDRAACVPAPSCLRFAFTVF
jgi:ABC-type sugar transport system substrate-binding protein